LDRAVRLSGSNRCGQLQRSLLVSRNDTQRGGIKHCVPQAIGEKRFLAYAPMRSIELRDKAQQACWGTAAEKDRPRTSP
jgi:hypothetical protein